MYEKFLIEQSKRQTIVLQAMDKLSRAEVFLESGMLLPAIASIGQAREIAHDTLIVRPVAQPVCKLSNSIA
jgi:hypothetical protein